MGNLFCPAVFDDEADSDFESNTDNMDKDRLEYLKKRRQSHQHIAKTTCDYMKDNLPAGSGEGRRGSGKSGALSPVPADRRGSMAISARRGSVMVVPPKPKKEQRERTDSIF